MDYKYKSDCLYDKNARPQVALLQPPEAAKAFLGELLPAA
jgi:hypothetical protein